MTAKIKLNAASGGGSISIQAPSSSSNNRVISLPDIADGTLLTSQSSLDSTKLSPAIATGKVLQVVQVENTAFTTSSANSGGQTGQMMDASITPSATSSKILIQAMFHISISAGPLRVACRLIINDNYNANTGNGANVDNRRYISSATIVQSNDDQQNIHYSYLHTANTTSSTKYGFTFLHGSGSTRTISMNRAEDNNNVIYNHTGISTIILTEIGA